MLEKNNKYLIFIRLLIAILLIYYGYILISDSVQEFHYFCKVKCSSNNDGILTYVGVPMPYLKLMISMFLLFYGFLLIVRTHFLTKILLQFVSFLFIFTLIDVVFNFIKNSSVDFYYFSRTMLLLFGLVFLVEKLSDSIGFSYKKYINLNLLYVYVVFSLLFWSLNSYLCLLCGIY